MGRDFGTCNNSNNTQTVTSVRVPGWTQFGLSFWPQWWGKDRDHTDTGRGNPDPPLAPAGHPGQGHRCNSRKNVVQAPLIIPASSADFCYNMNSWIRLRLPHSMHTEYPLWDWLSGSSTKLLTTPWAGMHQDSALAKRSHARSVESLWVIRGSQRGLRFNISNTDVKSRHWCVGEVMPRGPCFLSQDEGMRRGKRRTLEGLVKMIIDDTVEDLTASSHKVSKP